MMPIAMLLCLATRGMAGLQIVSQVAAVDEPHRQAVFSIFFNRSPDFAARDSSGRPLESFQYEVMPGPADMAGWSLAAVEAVVRGDEVDPGGRLPIREGFEPASDPDPRAGGWGPVRGTVPFVLEGDRLTFTAPLSLLEDPSGEFAYRLLATTSGQTTSVVEGTAVPGPPALWTGGIMLAGLAPLLARRRRLR